ncbi:MULTISPECIES: flagellar hook assembly protein FlgD [unclassified Methylocaldum]|jgi:flagellar basal-body rod modification protein FlgD|uniref:flagellar hook assembly protein FlgD n=1 Tax=unclassified Methylocaldum TaxID=2622260 RepID=UPI00098B674F|nr:MULTISPECIES: flagellar hook assembly protein FlgD [unclassified Methylocaldum]MBP1151000.1 flagellar basal-body rod modification protein FlgD [Methylocaldum sp. RMAD-M]MDV3241764.1 flagellar hook assembly protein FlgD [Methylocaldum sp.]
MSLDINTLKSLGLTETAAPTRKRNELGQEDFFKLMVTQLTSQNPLKPQDGAEFVNQLAQFSTVTGIQQLQSSFADFAASANKEQALMAANLVGRSALIASDKAILAANGTIQGELAVPYEASQVNIRIMDKNGNLIRTLELGPQTEGPLSFEWDGKLDDELHFADPGLYRIKAEAVIAGKTTALETQIAAPVESVTVGGSKGMEVQLSGLGRYTLGDIRAVL